MKTWNLGGCVLILLTLLSTFVSGQIDCTELADGAYGAGCKSYTLCTDGVGVIIDCAEGYVYDHITKTCQPQDTVGYPCGTNQNCSGVADGKYPILPDCYFFYTCQDGVNHGTGPCNPPDTTYVLKFDYYQQSCNWPDLILPPCGTYVPTSPAPTVPLFGNSD